MHDSAAIGADGVWWGAIRAAVAAHDPEPVDPAGRPTAAVLVPLLPTGDEPHVLFTVRSYEVEHHKGEISFPGGMIEEGEGPEAAALREAWEEVGIGIGEVEVLGPLSHFITSSGFHIRPFVGLLPHAPYAYNVNPAEVADVLEVPLNHLFDDANATYYRRELNGSEVTVREYLWGDHVITGATAWMLRIFLAMVAEQLGRVHD